LHNVPPTGICALAALRQALLTREPAAFWSVLIPPRTRKGAKPMGRYLLLWLLGVPIPILLLIWVFGGLT
jgi:hypothetical protein